MQIRRVADTTSGWDDDGFSRIPKDARCLFTEFADLGNCES